MLGCFSIAKPSGTFKSAAYRPFAQIGDYLLYFVVTSLNAI
jgi:hypothetical protein